jgi:hypothetical protein
VMRSEVAVSERRAYGLIELDRRTYRAPAHPNLIAGQRTEKSPVEKEVNTARSFGPKMGGRSVDGTRRLECLPSCFALDFE